MCEVWGLGIRVWRVRARADKRSEPKDFRKLWGGGGGEGFETGTLFLETPKSEFESPLSCAVRKTAGRERP